MKRVFLHGGLVISILLGCILILAQAEKQQEKPSPADASKSATPEAQTWEDTWGFNEDPFLEIERMHRIMEQLMHSRFAERHGLGRSSYLEPRIDLEESDKEIVIRCDLPGIDKDKVEVTLREDIIVIQGSRELIQEENKEEGGAKVYRSERSLGSFYRVIPLPAHVDEKNAKADYQNGVLTIRLPKLLQEEEKGVKIQVT